MHQGLGYQTNPYGSLYDVTKLNKRMTDLLRVGRPQGQATRSKHVLFAIVRRRGCEDIWIQSLQVLNQLHVDSGR